jgi:F-type H+-transporting ATPase subunit b
MENIYPNYTIVIQFFNFLVLLVLLNFLLFKPVLKAINKREQTIGSLNEKTRVLGDEAKDLGREYDEGAKEKKRPILVDREAALSEAHAASTRTIEKARTDLSDELLKVKERIDREGRTVYDSLKTEVDRLSAEAAQKILRRSL